MSDTTKQEIRDKAVAGEEIPETLVNELRKKETPEGAQQPPAGGVAAMAQSIHDKQQNFQKVVDEVNAKPDGELTQEDASRVMSAESRAMGGIRPPTGTISAHIQSVAAHNDQAKEQEGDKKDGGPQDQQ